MDDPGFGETEPVQDDPLQAVVLAEPARAIVIRHEEAHLRGIDSRFLELAEKAPGRADHGKAFARRCVSSPELYVPCGPAAAGLLLSCRTPGRRRQGRARRPPCRGSRGSARAHPAALRERRAAAGAHCPRRRALSRRGQPARTDFLSQPPSAPSRCRKRPPAWLRAPHRRCARPSRAAGTACPGAPPRT